MTNTVINGMFLIGGALLGSVGGLGAVLVQAFFERNKEREQRMFDARRVAYTDLLAFFTDCAIKRTARGYVFEAGNFEDLLRPNQIISAATILSGKAVQEKAGEITTLFKSSPNRERPEEGRLMNELIALMRKEIGIE